MAEHETVTVFNKSRRPWELIAFDGTKASINTGESMMCRKDYGQRMAKLYPRELTTSNPTIVVDTEALKRREQSVKDKEAALKDRETLLDAREKELDKREKEISERAENAADISNDSAPKKHAGRPPKTGN
ncbi:MAG: hypothetical protein WC900_07525 [Oscillospiraceae bacterium]|jgi:hypothetical protein